MCFPLLAVNYLRCMYIVFTLIRTACCHVSPQTHQYTVAQTLHNTLLLSGIASTIYKFLIFSLVPKFVLPEILSGLLVAAFSRTNIWKLSFNNSVSHHTFIHSTSRIVKIQTTQAGYEYVLRVCMFIKYKKTVLGFELFSLSLSLILSHGIYICEHKYNHYARIVCVLGSFNTIH